MHLGSFLLPAGVCPHTLICLTSSAAPTSPCAMLITMLVTHNTAERYPQDICFGVAVLPWRRAVYLFLHETCTIYSWFSWHHNLPKLLLLVVNDD